MPRAFRLHRFDWILVVLVGAFVWAVFSSSKGGLGGYEPSPSDSGDGGFQPLGWRDLKLLDLDGQLVRVPGYIVPLEDFQSRTSHFLLVPYLGACIHSPPPPANQIVAVRMVDGPVAFEMWETYWISGQLFIEQAQSPYGPAAFHMRGLEISPFEVRE